MDGEAGLMRGLLRIVALNISMLVSLVLLVLSFKDPQQPISSWQWVLITVCFIASGLVFLFDFLEWRKRPWKDLKGSSDIRNYMFDWISSASSAAVFSRDMSWVQDDAMRAMLREKARTNSLVLVLPREIALSAELKAAGAEVIYYPDISYTIKSRFTVVDLDSHNTRVAIGRTDGDVHRVQEISAGSSPSLSLAIDMLELVRRFAGEKAA